jgi:hypothetical protein
VETLHMLQHHPIVQCWAEAQDLTPRHELYQLHKSFAWCWQHDQGYFDRCTCPPPGPYDGGHTCQGHHRKKYYAHPGFAWAIRREAFDALGGLLDTGVCGAGDWHMAQSLIGRGQWSVPNTVTKGYLAPILAWQERAQRYLRRDIGYVDGTLTHAFHGSKKCRRYQERWDIVTKNLFDPATDLKRDWQGLYQLVDETPRQWKLRDDLRRYFQERNEDSIECEPNSKLAGIFT